MSEDKAHKLNLFADNLLKLVIAALVALLTYIGQDLQEKVTGVEKDVGAMKVQIAELVVVTRYLGNNPPTK